MRKKSPGWPQYMEQKRSGGGLRYFWNAPSWARKRGYPVKSEPLGADYTAAKARCDDYLNPLFEAWRTGGDAKRVAPAGSVDWMFAEYKGSEKYTKLPARTRSGYDRAMGDVADYILKDGRRVGKLHVKSVDAEFVDKIYDKLKIGPDGTPRNRSALLSISVSKLAWNVVHRNKPAIVPEVNPFKGVDIDYEPKHNRAATLAEVMQFVRGADEDGTLSIGTAALLAFYWLVRDEDIFSRMAWSDYRPGLDFAAASKASRVHEHRVQNMPKRKTDKLARAKARPDPAQWGEDEVMTLPEAAAIFFPNGPLKLSSLRSAKDAGTLEIANVAGKDLTTPRAIRKLVKLSCLAAKPSRRDSGSGKTKDAGSSSIGQAESDGRSAQAAAATTLTALRRRSKNTSARYTQPQSGQPTLVPSPLPTCSLSMSD